MKLPVAFDGVAIDGCLSAAMHHASCDLSQIRCPASTLCSNDIVRARSNDIVRARLLLVRRILRVPHCSAASKHP